LSMQGNWGTTREKKLIVQVAKIKQKRTKTKNAQGGCRPGPAPHKDGRLPTQQTWGKGHLGDGRRPAWKKKGRERGGGPKRKKLGILPEAELIPGLGPVKA